MLAATEMAEQVWRAWERVRSKAMLVAVEAKRRKVREANCLVSRSVFEVVDSVVSCNVIAAVSRGHVELPCSINSIGSTNLCMPLLRP